MSFTSFDCPDGPMDRLVQTQMLQTRRAGSSLLLLQCPPDNVATMSSYKTILHALKLRVASRFKSQLQFKCPSQISTSLARLCSCYILTTNHDSVRGNIVRRKYRRHNLPTPFRCAVHLFSISHPLQHQCYSLMNTLFTNPLLTYPPHVIMASYSIEYEQHAQKILGPGVKVWNKALRRFRRCH